MKYVLLGASFDKPVASDRYNTSDLLKSCISKIHFKQIKEKRNIYDQSNTFWPSRVW